MPRSASVDANSRSAGSQQALSRSLSCSASVNSRVSESDLRKQTYASSQTSRRKKKDDFQTGFLNDIKNRLHRDVHFSSSSNDDPVMVGGWPAWANSISVRDNPIAFWDSVPSPPRTLTREQFCAPNVFFLSLQMPRFYPRGKPK